MIDFFFLFFGPCCLREGLCLAGVGYFMTQRFTLEISVRQLLFLFFSNVDGPLMASAAAHIALSIFMSLVVAPIL